MSSSIQPTVNDIWRQASEQLNPIDGLSAIETQSDAINYALQSLIADLQADNVVLSTKTKNALALLQSISAHSTVVDSDVSNPSGSQLVQNLLNLKALMRSLQLAYFTAKQKFGF